MTRCLRSETGLCFGGEASGEPTYVSTYTRSLTIGVACRHSDSALRLFKENQQSMPAFQNPGFQERQQAAALARSAALAKYKARPPVDEAVIAERAARHAARDKAAVEKRAAAIRAKEAAARAKEEAAEAKREQARQAALATEAATKADPAVTSLEGGRSHPHFQAADTRRAGALHHYIGTAMGTNDRLRKARSQLQTSKWSPIAGCSRSDIQQQLLHRLKPNAASPHPLSNRPESRIGFTTVYGSFWVELNCARNASQRACWPIFAASVECSPFSQKLNQSRLRS